MSLESGSLQVERLIVHEIPRRLAKESKNLRVTERESTLEQEDKNFFTEKIKSSLAKTVHEATFDSEQSSPIPDLINRILSKEDQFVEISQKIASHLYGCQTGSNPPGALVIAKVKIADHKGVAILKIEKEEGMQFEPFEDENGMYICNVQQLTNLMLTGGKVFKIGLFIEASDPSSIACYVSDKQNSTRSEIEIAKFFLESFLGCRLLESAELKTKKFFNLCQNFINLHVEDPEHKINYEIALLAMIQSNQDTIDPFSFASTHLKGNDRHKFLDFFSKKGVSISSFEKNITSIKNLVNSMRLSFVKDNSSIDISGDSKSLSQIKVKKTSEGKVQVTFEAELKRVGK